ncbi:MAG: 50S ribosomal protein L18 [Candidatus Omnitrophica bacterium]|nr:50S ribosomal protein L18 [Candidatus Omnitrophota bacterium]
MSHVRLEGIKRRHGRIRKKLSGTSERPRVNVFRSLRHTYVQAIDDTIGRTLAAASTKVLGAKQSGNKKAAEALGEKFSEILKKKGLTKIVFDRGGYLYHGRVQVLADSLRKNGITF